MRSVQTDFLPVDTHLLSNSCNNETINKVIAKFHREGLISKNANEGLKHENPQTLPFYSKR